MTTNNNIITLHKVRSSEDEDLNELGPMLEESFRLTLKEANMEDEDIPLPKADDLIEAVDAGMDLLKIYAEDILIGGALIEKKDEKTNILELLFISGKKEGKGLGTKAWKAIEDYYPETVSWETETPYFQKRNISFYLNNCGFHIVEFFNKHHPKIIDGLIDEGEFFLFSKERISK